MFKNKTILISGGTGSFGKHYLDYLLKLREKPKKIIIFSRGEFKQSNLELKYKNFRNILRFFLGDVRDKNRLDRALEGVNFVIHAAALKQVPAAEYNPIEFIKTNIIGTQNIIEASILNKISKFILLSTDKACSPLNLYGATKLSAEKLCTSANNIIGNKNIKLSIVRYGNVMGSRGSVLPTFLEQKKTGVLKITHKDMTRFHITLDDAVKLVNFSFQNMLGGEIFIPKLRSFKIIDLAKIVAPKSKIKFIGLRPGEKIHEELVSLSEEQYLYDVKKNYVILNHLIEKRFKSKKYKKTKSGINYNSGNESFFMKPVEIKKLSKIKMVS